LINPLTGGLNGVNPGGGGWLRRQLFVLSPRGWSTAVAKRSRDPHAGSRV